MKMIRGIYIFGLFLFSCAREAPQKTNVIYIMADDLGYGDVGVFGQKVIQTPNIDKLAAEGIMLTRHYAGNTVCAPSRCTLMTGLHNGHAAIRGNKRVPLKAKDFTVAELFKTKGYTTGLVGKWGLGEEGSSGIPNKQGFDYFYGYLNQAKAHNYYPAFLYENQERDSLDNLVETVTKGYAAGIGGHSTNKETYSNNKFQEKSLDFLHQNKDNPFFLYLALTLPHANNESHHFGESGMEIPSYGIYENESWPNHQKGHAAMITELDRTVGLVMEQLKADGLDEKTLVIFTSDNGPHNEGGADSDFFDSNGPYRGTKRDLYDGGIRVPTIARWSGSISPGTSSNHLSGFVDFLETMAELLGEKAETKKTDGISYLPALLGKTQKKHEFMYWEFGELGGKKGVIFNEKWKCIQLNVNDSTQARLELYDLEKDIKEENNLANEFPELVQRALTIMEREHTFNPDFNFKYED
ncbi:MAG: arylsulfatase A-like enzyme [Arcticibacterium sp.]|jgi:arylsulfatase A-like enzyme